MAAKGIKIAFFDIDGTLLEFGALDIHDKVKRALRLARERGVKLFLATGRPPYAIPDFEGVTFDGALCFNGGYCFDESGLIYACPLDKEDVRTVIRNASAMGLATEVATARKMGANGYQDELEEYMEISHHSCDILEDFDEVLEEDIFQLMLGTTEELDEKLMEGTSRLKVARWWDKAMDVIPAGCGKAHGIQKVLEHYGYSRSEAIAFGDGGNDMDMITYAGCGVAMGNAEPVVKAAADYVTDTVAEDGVAAALYKLVLGEAGEES